MSSTTLNHIITYSRKYYTLYVCLLMYKSHFWSETEAVLSASTLCIIYLNSDLLHTKLTLSCQYMQLSLQTIICIAFWVALNYIDDWLYSFLNHSMHKMFQQTEMPRHINKQIYRSAKVQKLVSWEIYYFIPIFEYNALQSAYLSNMNYTCSILL